MADKKIKRDIVNVPEGSTETEIVEEVAKKKRGLKPASLEKNLTATIEERKQALRNVRYWSKATRVETDEECAERIEIFFDRMAETGELPTVEKLSLALGVDRNLLYDWEHGSKGSRRGNIIKTAKQNIASLDAEFAATGKIPPAVYIFRAKNFFGMRDVVDVSVGRSEAEEEKTPEALAEKYADVVVDADGNLT